MSLPSSEFPAGPLVLDASVLFNILGTGKPKAILQAVGVECWVEQRTAAEVRRMPGQRTEGAPLQPLFEDGCLQLCRMSDDAYETYISLVGGAPTETLDDGESAAIAVATNGLGSVVLDDKKARRILSSRFGVANPGSSLTLLLTAATRANWTLQELRAVITAARTVSRMAVIPDERTLFSDLFAETASG